MTLWRPASRIRVKALGLHWRSNRLLAAEVTDDSGHVKGVRPLGGSVEFGETAETALIREFQEELGITVRPVGPPFFMENLFFHEGMPGHEILVIFDIDVPADTPIPDGRLRLAESDGSIFFADWFDLDALDVPGGLPLFPTGLKARLRPR